MLLLKSLNSMKANISNQNVIYFQQELFSIYFWQEKLCLKVANMKKFTKRIKKWISIYKDKDIQILILMLWIYLEKCCLETPSKESLLLLHWIIHILKACKVIQIKNYFLLVWPKQVKRKESSFVLIEITLLTKADILITYLYFKPFINIFEWLNWLKHEKNIIISSLIR